MAAASNNYTVRGLVFSYMNRKRMKDMNDYEYLEQLAFEGVRHLDLHHNSNFNVTHHIVSEGMITLPNGYVDYMAVAVEQNGQLIMLALNKHLYNPNIKSVDGDIQYMTPESISSYGDFTFEPHYYRGSWYPALYGIGTGFAAGYFNVDRENGVMYIDGRVSGSEIVLQWVGVADLCSESCIDPKWHETLLAWIDWKVAQGDDRKQNLVQMRKAEYEQQKVQSAMSEMPGLWDFAELISLGTRRGVKQ